MKIPLSWLKEYVDIDLDLEELAYTLTMVGLEVDEIKLVGLPMPPGDLHGFKYTGIEWAPDKFVVAQIDEVMPHPNADRLTLCRLQDGAGEKLVLTGAPNLYDYKGIGPLEKPLKVAYARLGATLYDGHQPGFVLTTLKKTKIRGVESDSMVASEKELGISDEHEGIIILDDDAPTGMPLADYMGDAVFEISILPNMIRDASVMGVAREIAAVTGKPLRKPTRQVAMTGPSMRGEVSIDIREPELNPRFVLGLLRGAKPLPSPYWVQRRLRLAGMRPINSIVDATNYVMLEAGEPLHAFDYDKLKARANGKTPVIITRRAENGEKLTTLDSVEHTLEDYTILVTDTAGPLSLAGIMGGEETEVDENTTNVLLEGAAWNFINVRRTATYHHINSEAGYRFARGVHPALAEQGVRMCLERMAAWSGGEIAADLVDEYPNPPVDPVVTLSAEAVSRGLGVELSADEIANLLRRLEFVCEVEGDMVRAATPPHRLDIGEGVIGRADLMEEVARMYGYDKIPYTRLSSELPVQRENRPVKLEDKVKDTLAGLGLREIINYRLTSPEREARAHPQGVMAGEADYVRLANPIAPERAVMRRSLLPGILEILERNSRLAQRLAFFETGPVFWPVGERLPKEARRLCLGLSGLRELPTWDQPVTTSMDFFDLKGVIEALLDALHISGAVYRRGEHPAMHPNQCAEVWVGEQSLGVFGELHPLVKEKYDLPKASVLVADLDLEAIMAVMGTRFEAQPVPVYPAVLEDLAVIVDETVPADQVEAVLRRGGGKLLVRVELFDIYRGAQIGEGKKSLAYSLSYQAADHTLDEKEALKIREKIIKNLDRELGAKIRS
ncbi:MAG: phenylalanine--tRNA ligase subunit beta [Chloroflexi bacterium]|nr:phenylalanine--tRNA ligase subunit beta [Chloroflexota bacterium]